MCHFKRFSLGNGYCHFQLPLKVFFCLTGRTVLVTPKGALAWNRSGKLQKYRASVPKGAGTPVSLELSWVKRV